MLKGTKVRMTVKVERPGLSVPTQTPAPSVQGGLVSNGFEADTGQWDYDGIWGVLN